MDLLLFLSAVLFVVRLLSSVWGWNLSATQTQITGLNDRIRNSSFKLVLVMNSQVVFVRFRFLLENAASLTAVNCDGDVPLDIALDETTESLLQDFSLKQGESSVFSTLRSKNAFKIIIRGVCF